MLPSRRRHAALECFPGPGAKLVYRGFATLYFIAICDAAESELGLLDLIQVFVETLDKVFENVCELDIIFNSPKVRNQSFERACMLPWRLPPVVREEIARRNRGRDWVRRSPTSRARALIMPASPSLSMDLPARICARTTGTPAA